MALYKCVNCNCFTHCVLASPFLKELRQRAEAAESAAPVPTVQIDFLNENSNMSGSVESLSSSSQQQQQQQQLTQGQLNLASQSSWQTMSSDTGFADSNSTSNPAAASSESIMQRVVIVSTQMIVSMR